MRNGTETEHTPGRNETKRKARALVDAGFMRTHGCLLPTCRSRLPKITLYTGFRKHENSFKNSGSDYSKCRTETI
jgi:hypothetical protein